MGKMTLAVQFARLIVAIRNASALVVPACCTKPSKAGSTPEHINEAKPPYSNCPKGPCLSGSYLTSLEISGIEEGGMVPRR
jgi:hypothetical protein